MRTSADASSISQEVAVGDPYVGSAEDRDDGLARFSLEFFSCGPSNARLRLSLGWRKECGVDARTSGI